MSSEVMIANNVKCLGEVDNNCDVNNGAFVPVMFHLHAAVYWQFGCGAAKQQSGDCCCHETDPGECC